jgi:tetratricopeptide (TPR) repeat protein
MFFESYELAKEAYLSNINNAEAYVEAAHALGRYGQKIGIMSAITEGIADRVKRYLDKAITIDPENIIANLSKGIWHSEIINQAGKTLAKAVYGADASKARIHFTKVYKINNKEISILYELAYGYYLLGKDEDLRLSKRYIEELLSLKEVAHIDTIYKKQALILKDLISK